MRHVTGPFKVAFRGDEKTATVRAFLLPFNQDHPGPGDEPFLTIRAVCLEKTPGAFEAFKKLGRQVCAALTESVVGVKPDGWSERKPPGTTEETPK